MKKGKIHLDFMMALIIFIVSIIEFISWRLSFGAAATITDVGNNYLIFWYPFLSSLVIWFFSVFFLLKIIRYEHCIYTDIITIVYFIVQTINILAFIFQFGIDLYNQYIYPVFLFTIMGLTLIKSIRWLLYNRFSRS
jgi:hypothetical protein